MAKKDGGSGEIAAQQQADEQARQARIREGTAAIDKVFDGAPTGGDQIAAGASFDPNKTYYLADGSVWQPSTNLPPSTGGGGGIAGSIISALPGLQQNQEFNDAISKGLYGSVTRSGGFDDAFYNKQRQNYIDYASPQLDKQYGDAQKQLTYALARGGNLDSSARADLEGQLKQKYDQNSQQIADQGLSYENQSKNAVEDARSQLISLLNTTGDATGVANNAVSRAQALSAPPAYSALTNLFTDFTNGLGTVQAQQQANAYANAYGVPNRTGLFAPNPGAVTVK